MTGKVAISATLAPGPRTHTSRIRLCSSFKNYFVFLRDGAKTKTFHLKSNEAAGTVGSPQDFREAEKLRVKIKMPTLVPVWIFFKFFPVLVPPLKICTGRMGRGSLEGQGCVKIEGDRDKNTSCTHPRRLPRGTVNNNCLPHSKSHVFEAMHCHLAANTSRNNARTRRII